ncbi:MAG TPA: molybdate ABC transporter substrate-binding protein [Solirubrobacterales bacterium]|nr:molybdate ABC transporter substrate-binding protein [Solirubrobacterales bacterium]
MPIHSPRAALIAVLAALLWGCGGDAKGGDAGEDGGALTIAAASSLRDAFRVHGEHTPGEERFSFAASDQLAAQIRQGAGPDLYAAADRRYAEELAAEGLVEAPLVFARNELVVAVPADSPIRSIEDLAEGGRALVIGADGVPAGEYAREAIAALDPPLREAIQAGVRSEEPDVKGVVGKLLQGAADAGFVYTTDVVAAAGALRAIPLPRGASPAIEYAIGVVASTETRERARAFAEGLLEGPGARTLAEAGFEAPG